MSPVTAIIILSVVFAVLAMLGLIAEFIISYGHRVVVPTSTDDQAGRNCEGFPSGTHSPPPRGRRDVRHEFAIRVATANLEH